MDTYYVWLEKTLNDKKTYEELKSIEDDQTAD